MARRKVPLEIACATLPLQELLEGVAQGLHFEALADTDPQRVLKGRAVDAAGNDAARQQKLVGGFGILALAIGESREHKISLARMDAQGRDPSAAPSDADGSLAGLPVLATGTSPSEQRRRLRR